MFKFDNANTTLAYIEQLKIRRVQSAQALEQKYVKNNDILRKAHENIIQGIDEQLIRANMLVDSAANETFEEALPTLKIDPRMYGSDAVYAISGKNILPMGDLMKGNLALEETNEPVKKDESQTEIKFPENTEEVEEETVIEEPEAEVILTKDEMLIPQERDTKTLKHIIKTIVSNENVETVPRIMVPLVAVLKAQPGFANLSVGDIIFRGIMPELNEAANPLKGYILRHIRIPILKNANPILAFAGAKRLYEGGTEDDQKSILWESLLTLWYKTCESQRMDDEQIGDYLEEKCTTAFHVDMIKLSADEITRKAVTDMYGEGADVEKKIAQITKLISLGKKEPAKNDDPKAHDPERPVETYENKQKTESHTYKEKQSKDRDAYNSGKEKQPNGDKQIERLNETLNKKFGSKKSRHKHQGRQYR